MIGMNAAKWVTAAGVLAPALLAASFAYGQCCGDCNGNGAISLGELQQVVNNFMGDCTPGQCMPAGSDLPASGQTTAYGPDSDGAVLSGGGLAYWDNGDGTITDLNTELIWEKKDDSAGVHGRLNLYSWGMATDPFTMDGTAVSDFLATLNTAPCFAGYCDWRIPNVKELQSILNYEVSSPSVDAVFHKAATCFGCTDVTQETCSCTRNNTYWASTTVQWDPKRAWIVNFAFGNIGVADKNVLSNLRAVRGGL